MPLVEPVAEPLLAAAGLVAALALYGSLYALWAGLRWPAIGKRTPIKGGRLHVIEAGAGPAVLMLHGASANAREWTPVMAAIGPGARLLAMDRPGHGHSRRMRRNHLLSTQAAAAAALIEAEEAGPAIVAAHSLGCATALRLALDRPDLVRGLVLAAPASHPYPGDNPWHTRVAAHPILGPLFCRLVIPWAAPVASRGAVAKTFNPAAEPQGYTREVGVGLLFRPKDFANNAREVVATKRGFEEQYWHYDRIEAATIVITADQDAVVSPRIHAMALARTLPNAELVVAPGAGHMPHRVRPEAVAAAVKRLLADMASAQAAE